ncbi:DUF2461 domain-containing protein [Actinospongicola halichondriae]|uniref:DUF2461 domain-containing protein n=1 Tax=Actinospongicola halichondriae TaxID=3236844 RepID=UPI003D55A80F
MTFTGFPVEAIEFFEGLEADNTKAYWTEHKATYLECVRAPMEALLDDLSGSFGEGKIFRPNRDIRFSKDKSPYKTNIAATMAKGGYVSLDADGFGTGTGYYMMAKDQLAKFRATIDDDVAGPEFEKLVERLRAADVEVNAHDSLKTAPRGYPKDHPRIELLRMKGCIAWRSWEIGAWLDSPEPVERVRQFLETAEPLVTWLDTNVGPSELENAWG